MRRPTLSLSTFMSVALLLGGALLDANIVSAQQITLISSASDGTAGTDGRSWEPSISADGRFVAFSSDATNLVPGDTNGTTDVFVKDRVSGAIERVSRRSTGDQSSWISGGPRLSANGRFVVFHSMDPLVPEDTNTCGVNPAPPCADVFVYDRQTQVTTRVSVSSSGAQGSGDSRVFAISADARFVLFGSASPNLVDNDTNNADDLFLHDRQTSTTTRVSLGLAGGQLPGVTWTGVMSADGRVIVYTGEPAPDGRGTLYLYERETGQRSVLSSTFPAPSIPSQYPPSMYPTSGFGATHISDDGRVIAVLESAGLVQTRPPVWPIFRHLLHDRLTGRTIATAWRGNPGPNDGLIIGVSGDGRTYAVSESFNSVVQLVDRVSGLRETIPTATGSDLRPLSFSTDGRYTAFSVTPQSGVHQQLYVYDRDSGDADGMPSAWETTFGLDPANLTDANADADLDGVTNLQEYVRGTHPSALASATRYFAEGAANAFFTTRLAAVNPGDSPASVVFRFLASTGESSSVIRTIAAKSRITLELPEHGPAPGNDFSTVVESNQTVVVDRTMTWDGTGYGAHAETAIAAPSTTWHLAEGATHGAFDLFYLLQNPNDSQVQVTIDYLRRAPLAPVTRTYTVEPNSRKTIPVDGEGPELEAVDVAAAITSTAPIVVERAMYSTRAGQPAFAAGHGAAGVTAPALRWFLAEGATGNFFDLYVLISNPGSTESTLDVTYLLPGGTPFKKPYSVGPRQRLTIYPQDEDARLANTPVSVVVESTNNQPVVVERAMWWPKGEWHETHVSAGATTTGTRWALADGEVSTSSETYILIANTSTTAGTATVTLLEEGGTRVTIPVNLDPSSRTNVPVSVYLPPTAAGPPRRFGALIESSGVEIVVERAMYSNAGGITWGAGTAALGTKLQ